MGNVNETLRTRIEELNLPKNLVSDLLVDVDMDLLATANVKQAGDVFQVATTENGVFHAFSFGNNVVVETADVIGSDGLNGNDVADLARIKRQRTLTGSENGFEVFTIESDRRFYSDDKGYKENISTVLASYNANGEMYDKKHTAYAPISKDGNLDLFANDPLPNLSNLTVVNTCNGIIDTMQNARAL